MKCCFVQHCLLHSVNTYLKGHLTSSFHDSWPEMLQRTALYTKVVAIRDHFTQSSSLKWNENNCRENVYVNLIKCPLLWVQQIETRRMFASNADVNHFTPFASVYVHLFVSISLIKLFVLSILAKTKHSIDMKMMWCEASSAVAIALEKKYEMRERW